MEIRKFICAHLLLVCTLSLQADGLYNAGNMYVGGLVNSAVLYIKGDLTAGGNSQIMHPGKTILTGNLINNVTHTNSFVFNDSPNGRSGLFVFQGTTPQRIYGSANKSTNPVKFPHTVILNNLHNINPSLTVDPDMSINLKDMTFIQGRLILDSKTADDKTVVAHLWLEDNAATINNNLDQPRIQVNLNIGAHLDLGRLIGFTPPFEVLHADYFFYNFLSVPAETDLFNGSNNDLWITDPLRGLTGGTGYILGQGLVPFSNTMYYLSSIDQRWKTSPNNAKFSDVINDKFMFGRYSAPASFKAILANEGIDGYTGEKLINNDVSITLNNGYNYLGNPFTVPLDLTDLLGNNRNEWGLATGHNVKRNYYILAPNSTGHSTDGVQFTFTASYLVGQKEGSTTDLYANNNLIAPMQMFVLKNEGGQIHSFKIPRSRRSHGDVSFLRSSKNEFTESVDELLIETRDTQTGGFDRLCIVFRDNADAKATDRYDTEKLFNNTGGVNQIYTRSADGKKLTTNVVQPTEKKLTMYFEPPLETQKIELDAYRLNSLHAINQVVLEDRQTGNQTDLTRNPRYTFYANPADRIDRFVLHFSSSIDQNDRINQSVLNAHYHEGIIAIQGLESNDLGKEISLYNMQGQLLHVTKITETPSYNINMPLQTGLYLLKIRDRKETIKLPVN
ncbi:T9SS type A sorting domain-containing protein [Parabacteroides sp. PF5-9]|uniref:T9SS type A sorting domain-containing protein n=1 Tax=Parabacteroides sp. PF5-9 TaxID=1742404 RepID=UPI0024772C06|nr:T9SS type A sorting domain-containing protein [Parabacteroides sp. PF5-9]MDH6357367.1 hypothetical protein [Parabacteroides sp. PF5-9]